MYLNLAVLKLDVFKLGSIKNLMYLNLAVLKLDVFKLGSIKT